MGILDYFNFIVAPNCNVKGFRHSQAAFINTTYTIMAFIGIVLIDSYIKGKFLSRK